MPNVDDRTALARLGEHLAARHLEACGLRILARNWRCPDPTTPGEVDLVAREGPTLVVCEVKTRRGAAAGAPLEAVTADKQRRLRRLAGVCAATLGGGPLRLDAVGIVWDGGDRAVLRHVRGIA